MNFIESLVRDTLADAARQAPEQAAPPSLGQRDSGRRLLPILAGASAIAVIAVITTSMAFLSLPDNPGVSPAANSSAGAGTVDLVGFDSVSLPIPDGWTFNDFYCGKPQSDTVGVQPSSIYAMCQGPEVEGVNSIILDDLESESAVRWRSTATEPLTLLDGTQALYGSATDEVGQFITAVVVPDLDAIAVGISPSPGQLDGVLSQLTAMPLGKVAIPPLQGTSWSAAVTALEGLGLVVQRRDVEGVKQVLFLDPRPGVVVSSGSTVTVTFGV